ncbi:28S ribosomal protein S15, mitochondrial [Venturia canescens]|uniref:28S ribosomal protein S15, mitochondrial n=1 Tax=Venturia canescens TaxID=32260 RepID=UPI001C9BE0B2|nr:28S ribosomal protein S15, mitochondrial [Venturia canescens]
MNALARTLRYVPSVVINLVPKNGGILSRTAAFKSNLKIKWVKPRKIASTMPEKSGDGGLELDVKPQDYVNRYEQSKELVDASDIVKRMFTLEFMPRRETRNKKRELILAMVQRHRADRGSMESRLAAMTAEILYLQDHLAVYSHDKQTKFFLKELIEKRKKFLGKLRRWDYKRFEWILEKLNLTYKPNPPLYFKVTRKRSMRMLTKRHCEKLKLNKLMEYGAELRRQQPDFFEEKAKKLEFIRQEEIACGREPTVTVELIAEAKRQAESLRKEQLQE